MEKRPLISFCIPTYNRGYILQYVLEQYIHDPEFDDDVELVISDNCSTDDTEKICKQYCSQRSNIRYYRNENNIKDANFFTVLDYGNGEYLKLLNDWTYCVASSLREVKLIIKNSIDHRKPLFFTNDKLFTQKYREIIECKNLDEYVQVVSTYVTSNNLFGVWREQWEKIENRERYTELKLQQEDWTYQIIANNSGCILYNKRLFSWSKVERKVLTGYNWFQIHLDNYYQIMKPYIEKNLISEKTYKRDRHHLLNHFKKEMCYTYFYNYTDNWRYDTKGTTAIIKKYYSSDSYLWLYFAKLPFYYVYLLIKSFAKTILIGLGLRH